MTIHDAQTINIGSCFANGSLVQPAEMAALLPMAKQPEKVINEEVARDEAAQGQRLV